MKKNIAGQKVGAQMVSATDGSAFTGSVTAYVTLDAGTQAIGTVGSGACAHEGNGYHTYAPSQAETNGDLVAVTFIGTGAIPTTVQVYTSFPQTQDHTFALTTIDDELAVADGVIDAVLVHTTRINALIENSSGDRFTAKALEEGPAAEGGLTAGAIADAVWDEATSGHTTSGTFGEQTKTDIDAILEDTGTTLNDLLVNTEDDVDVLRTDLEGSRTEPGTGAPPVSASILSKIDYLYKFLRNKKDNDGTQNRLYGDDASTVHTVQSTTVSGDTVTINEWGAP